MRTSDDAGYLLPPPHETRTAIDTLVRESPDSITIQRDLVIRRCARHGHHAPALQFSLTTRPRSRFATESNPTPLNGVEGHV